VTNDGVTILSEMDIEHPAAKELEKRVRVPIPPQTADKGERQKYGREIKKMRHDEYLFLRKYFKKN